MQQKTKTRRLSSRHQDCIIKGLRSCIAVDSKKNTNTQLHDNGGVLGVREHVRAGLGGGPAGAGAHRGAVLAPRHVGHEGASLFLSKIRSLTSHDCNEKSCATVRSSLHADGDRWVARRPIRTRPGSSVHCDPRAPGLRNLFERVTAAPERKGHLEELGEKSCATVRSSLHADGDRWVARRPIRTRPGSSVHCDPRAPGLRNLFERVTAAPERKGHLEELG